MKLDLYDSDTGESLVASKIVPLVDGDDPVSLVYSKAKRGRIVQVRRGKTGGVRIHYFFDEPEGMSMITQDERRNGVSLGDVFENAPS